VTSLRHLIVETVKKNKYLACGLAAAVGVTAAALIIFHYNRKRSESVNSSEHSSAERQKVKASKGKKHNAHVRGNLSGSSEESELSEGSKR
jgi:hypothetical protein